MAYVARNDQGEIIAVYDVAQKDAQEQISVNSEELLVFLQKTDNSQDAKAALSVSDRALIRVIEDLIQTLITKEVILFTDLPLAAREKLANREAIRGQLSDLLNLVDNDEGLL